MELKLFGSAAASKKMKLKLRLYQTEMEMNRIIIRLENQRVYWHAC